MAEYMWRARSRVAAASMLAACALLMILDLADRPTPQGVQQGLGVAAALLVAAVAAPLIPWERLRSGWRLLPVLVVLGAVLGAVYTADLVDNQHSGVGLTLVAAMVLVYTGLVAGPGIPLAVSPIVLVVLLIAQQAAPFGRVSIALPLLAVPLSAGIGELVATLIDRYDRAQATDSRRFERLERLERVLRRFRRPRSLREAASRVAEAAVEIFDVDRSTVVLRTSSGELISSTVGPLADNIPDTDTARLLGRTLDGEDPQLVPTGTNGTMLVIPLPANEVPAGAVLMYPINQDDTDFTIDLARLFGVQVGIAIEHLFVIDELSRATTRDELTGMGNRRHADKLIRSLDPGDALILLDLDGFKRVNDTLGHAEGDVVLRELSDHLRHQLRDSDNSARFGGDEFVIVARRAHADPVAVADRVLSGWEGRIHGTTLSAGVALQEPGVSTEETFARADVALYRAKAAGKNRAELWDPSMGPHSTVLGPPT